MGKYVANIITGCRVFCSILMLFFPVFTPGFYATYLACGLSDMIDGTVARKTNSASRFGAGFDTAADLLFTAVALMKLLSVIRIPGWLWIWTAAIAVIKIVNLVWGLLNQKRFITEHTVMNKITGFLLFLLPLTLPFVELTHSAAVVCAAATVSAIQEGFLIRAGREVV